MKYNITITNDSSLQAKSILMMLRTLAMDYDFLQIEQESLLPEDLKQELDFRYEHFLNHADEYKDWDAIKHKYVKQ